MTADSDSGEWCCSKLYWSECGTAAEARRIMTASMDASSVRALVADRLRCPISLHTDLPSARLYWAEHDLNTIDSIGLDGTKRRVRRKTKCDAALITIYTG